MKMNEDTNESSTTTKLTFFDVHDVSLNALGLLASHDQKTKKEMGSRSNGNKEGDGLLACLHSIRTIQCRRSRYYFNNVCSVGFVAIVDTRTIKCGTFRRQPGRRRQG